ncbi:prepilin-type N-terminal cleavage/methylation domain-containing protein [Tissierella sp. MB52-C2]|uniref:PilW family protein n=1 Tax=Tissierella sp. MB52-C2 TaxID=3070999 RepID=UPI00280BC4D4|nr:prepilin-type N-terminal cleavage/methylation domain-containing protein [Tissierella sp. MB52-C2]WMM26940.1 prepilin-type N-terminal cleavage/methylation domain-containing protein [Tissierella sp. MB52-C2]
MKNNKGLTLIELIITIAIMAIVLQMIYSILFVGNKSFNLGKNKGFIQKDARIVSELITKELRTAKEIRFNEKTIKEEHFSLEANNGSLIKKTYNDSGIENEDKRQTLFTNSLRGIEFNPKDTNPNGIINITIEIEEETNKNSETYSINFNILLENIPTYRENNIQNKIYYSKYN